MSKQLNLFGENLLDEETLLTKREMIESIVEAISERLWESDYDMIVEVANTAGIEVTGYHEAQELFWIKD